MAEAIEVGAHTSYVVPEAVLHRGAFGGSPCLLRPMGSFSAPGDHPVIGREGLLLWLRDLAEVSSASYLRCLLVDQSLAYCEVSRAGSLLTDPC